MKADRDEFDGAVTRGDTRRARVVKRVDLRRDVCGGSQQCADDVMVCSV